MTPEDMRKLVYTSRQLNTIGRPMQLFNCAIFCSTTQFEMVSTALEECYDHIETVYWHNKALPLTGISKTMKCS